MALTDTGLVTMAIGLFVVSLRRQLGLGVHSHRLSIGLSGKFGVTMVSLFAVPLSLLSLQHGIGMSRLLRWLSGGQRSLVSRLGDDLAGTTTSLGRQRQRQRHYSLHLQLLLTLCNRLPLSLLLLLLLGLLGGRRRRRRGGGLGDGHAVAREGLRSSGLSCLRCLRCLSPLSPLSPLSCRFRLGRLGRFAVQVHARRHSQWSRRPDCRRVVISPSSTTRCGLRWIGPLLASDSLAI